MRTKKSVENLVFTCEDCGTEFTNVPGKGAPKTRWCNRRCFKRFKKKEAKKQGRELVIQFLSERSKGLCGICLKPVDIERVVPDPWAPTVDHIHPLSKGGKNVISNVRLAHFRCNSVKCDIEERSDDTPLQSMSELRMAWGMDQ